MTNSEPTLKNQEKQKFELTVALNFTVDVTGLDEKEAAYNLGVAINNAQDEIQEEVIKIIKRGMA